MIYLLIILLLLFLTYRYDYRQATDGKRMWFVIMFIIFVLVAGLRYRLGQDTLMYIRSYAKLHPITLITLQDFQDSRFAPGFILITSVFKAITPDFTLFQVFHALIVNSVVFWFIKNNTKNIFFALFLFFLYLYFLLCFQQMRESIAVSVFLLAWPAFRDRKWLWWYLAACVAVTFHVSAFMMFILPVICLPVIRQLFVFGWRTPLMCGIILVFGFVMQTVFFKYVEALAVTESMMERATTYAKSDLGTSVFNFNRLLGSALVWVVYPLIALSFIYNKRNRDTAKILVKGGKRMEMMVIMSLYVSVMALAIPILGRFNNYFFIFSIVILSDWIYSALIMHGKRLRLSFAYWILLFMPMLGFHFYITYMAPLNKSGTMKNYMVYYPYNSYFDQEKNQEREKAVRYIYRHI